MSALTPEQLSALATDIKRWGRELGFAKVGISDTQLDEAETRLEHWLATGKHGEMEYMARHGTKRSRPAELEPGTCRVIAVRMDYLPESARDAQAVLDQPQRAYISRYALGRDYHKVLRQRLQRLADRIRERVADVRYRVFVDSAPVLEKPLAEKAGLGWIGKHTNLLSRDSGSWFFLGELYTDLPLPVDEPESKHCGTCAACIDICPTSAIIAPFELDARLCISYLTIEHKSAIPEALRPHVGNRIYGCDDCQLVCPWNKYAQLTREPDFAPRHNLASATLVELFKLNETEFLALTEGTAIRRIGYERWQRNLAVALGNAPTSAAIITALQQHRDAATPLVREHIDWALQRQRLGIPDSDQAGR